MASDKLMNHTQGETIITKLTSIADSLDDIAAISPAKLGLGMGVCDTAASTAAKTVAIANYTITEGSPVSVQFLYANTAANATLNINNTGAKPILYKGNPLGNNVISAGDTCTFIYTTNSYRIINIDTLTGAGTGTVTQVGAENGLITDQTDNADIQRDGKIGLNLKSTTAFSTEVSAHNTSTDNMYPVALDSEGHPVAAVPNGSTTAKGTVQLTDSVGTSSGASETDVPTEKAVAEAIESIGKPMVWTGTITLTADSTDTTKCSIAVSKPASTANIKQGMTYRIGSIAASPVYTGPYKVGDTFIASKDEPTVTASWVVGTDWDYTPSGDEPSGTVTGVKMTSAGTTNYPDGDGVVTLTAFVGSGSGHKAGLVPDTPSTAGAAKYLCENGDWTVPPSFGSSELDTVRVLNQPDTWETKTWSGLTSFNGDSVWTDGENIYYSYSSNQYVLNKSTSTWSTKTWTGLTSFSGQYIWTDGEDIYYSSGPTQRVLDKSTSTWSTKTWTGLTSLEGIYIWTDGDNIYYSNGSSQYVLNKATSTWSAKSWSGLTDFYGNSVWTDGENIYYSYGSTQYVLDKSTSTWSSKTWTGLTTPYGRYIYTDGDNIYFSLASTQYVLDKSTSTWSSKTWTGLTSFNGNFVWTDGENIYYSYDSDQYVLKRPLKTTKIPDVKNNAQLTALIGNINSVLEAVL